MSIVRFASVCDYCGRRSAEYMPHAQCRECLADICDGCMPHSDPETGRVVCAACMADSTLGRPADAGAESSGVSL